MTEQAKPTPGPWRDHVVVLSRNNQKGLLRQENTIVRRGADVIAMVFGVTADEEKANARLLAAAPELLEALEIIAGSEEFHSDSIVCDFGTLQSVARAAIAKARGGSDA